MTSGKPANKSGLAPNKSTAPLSAASKAQANSAVGKVPSSALKPGKSANRPAALPDAALIDNDDDAPAETRKLSLASLKPRTMRGWLIAGTAATSMLMLIVIATAVAMTMLRATPENATALFTGPASVVDGATIVIAGHTLHLDGIESPAATLVCQDGYWKYRCGEDARHGLSDVVGKSTLECRPVGDNRATCRNELGIDIASQQVENGWAVADIRRSSRYFVEQIRAQDDARGLWRNDFGDPESWRMKQSTEATAR